MTFTTIKSLLTSLILLFGVTSFAQSIAGKVLSDKEEPISYATVQIGEHFGVITNEEGSFSINTTGFEPTDSVKISCMGYEKIGMLLNEFESQDYHLIEKVNELSEVYLTNRMLTLDSILYYMDKNLDKNYKTKMVNYNLFRRTTQYIQGKNVNLEIDKSTGFKKKQLEAFNKEFQELGNSLLHNRSKQYTEFVADLTVLDEKKAKLTIDKAMRLLDERNDQSIEKLAERGKDIVTKHLDTNKVYTVKTGWFKISDSVKLGETNQENNKMEDTINSVGLIRKLTYEMLKEHNFKSGSIFNFVTDQRKYDYELKGISFLDSELVYVVDFKPRRGSADFEGTLYISNQTFAVLKTDYKYYKGRVGEKLNMKLLLGIKYAENGKAGSVIYKKGPDNYYYPKFITEEIDRYFYIDRPFKFKENDGNNKVSFEFLVEGTFKERNELLIMGTKDITNSDYEAIKEKKDIDYETPTQYDPNFWKDYNVLQPLQEMKDFKVDETYTP